MGVNGFGAAVEVSRVEVAIDFAADQHVISGSEDRGGKSPVRLLDAAAGAQAMELGLQIAQLLAGGGRSALHEGSLKPKGSLAHAGGAAFAGALIVFRAQSGPGDELPGVRERAHVATDLGKDDTSPQFFGPGDRGQKLYGRA